MLCDEKTVDDNIIHSLSTLPDDDQHNSNTSVNGSNANSQEEHSQSCENAKIMPEEANIDTPESVNDNERAESLAKQLNRGDSFYNSSEDDPGENIEDMTLAEVDAVIADIDGVLEGAVCEDGIVGDSNSFGAEIYIPADTHVDATSEAITHELCTVQCDPPTANTDVIGVEKEELLDALVQSCNEDIQVDSNQDHISDSFQAHSDSQSPDNEHFDSFDSSQPSLKSKSATPPPVWVWGSTLPDKRLSKRSKKKKGRLSMADTKSVCSDIGTREGSMFSLSPENFSASLNDLDNIDIASDYENLIDELKDVRTLNIELAEKLLRNSNTMLDYEQLKSSSIVIEEENKKMKEQAIKLSEEKKKIEVHKDVEIADLEKTVLKLMSDLEIADGTIRHVSEESEKRIKAVSEKYEAKIAHIDKKFIETIKEKDILASSLQETRAARMKLAANKETFIKNLSSKTEELERLRAKLHFSMDDCVKLKIDFDSKYAECANMTKELKRANDELSAAAIKIQWANTNLKSETESHHLTRTKLSGMNAKIRESKEEANMIRANCQAMINKYQNSEEIQSNALGNKLDKLEDDHKVLKLNFDNLTHEYQEQANHMKALNKSTDTIKNQLFDKESQYQKLLEEYRKVTSEKDNVVNQLEDLDEQLNSYNELKTELKNAYETNQKLCKEDAGLKIQLTSLTEGRDELADKERHNMEYFQKISSKNADLQLEVNSLKLEGEGLSRQLEYISAERNEIYESFSTLTITHDILMDETTKQIDDAQAEITQLQEAKENLETRVEEMINEAAVAKKKHTAGNKDLIRQIEQFRKQIERQEESMRRSESINSLDNGKDRAFSGASSEADDSLSVSGDSGATMSLEQARVMLIERLCMLQKQLAKRQEKLEFCESHIATLTRDIQRKSRVVQSLLLRVETGSRTSLASDAYKAGIENTGILPNLYGTRSNGMTLKLSIEINEKLQQVLEDTLFKNITLKENVKTLGDEIDRLNFVQNSP